MNIYKIAKGKYRAETRHPETKKRITKTLLAESKSHAESHAQKWLRELAGKPAVPSFSETLLEVLESVDRREISRAIRPHVQPHCLPRYNPNPSNEIARKVYPDGQRFDSCYNDSMSVNKKAGSRPQPDSPRILPATIQGLLEHFSAESAKLAPRERSEVQPAITIQLEHLLGANSLHLDARWAAGPLPRSSLVQGDARPFHGSTHQ